MSDLGNIKNKLQYIKRIANITASMKLAASTNRHRILMMIRNINSVQQNFDKCNQHLMSDNDCQNRKTAHIILASDQKFCGSFLSNIKNNMSEATFREDDMVIVIGKQLFEYIQSKCKQKIVKMNDLKTFEEAEYLASKIYEFPTKIYGSYDTHFATDIYGHTVQRLHTDDNVFDTVPQSDYKIIFILACNIYRRFLYSQLDENNARLQAMTEASENSSKQSKQLQTAYNKARQAAITKDIIALV